MSYVSILSERIVNISVDITIPTKSSTLKTVDFVVDTGATISTIDKMKLLRLGYTDEWIKENQRFLPLRTKIKAADNRVISLYKIPVPYINILGHVIADKDLCIYTSDTAKLSSLLGMDLLSYFNFNVDFDQGKVFFNFRDSRRVIQEKPGDSYAYQVGKPSSVFG